MKIAIANDHGGFNLKESIIGSIKDLGNIVIDLGTDSDQIVRYPYFAKRLCHMIQRGEADRGILICSTGIGMSMVANKFKGIRAALCHTAYEGRMTAAHNNANVLCLGGRCIGDYAAIDIIQAWLSTSYEGGRHDISLGLINEVEEATMKYSEWEFENDTL